jgi:predicted ATP-binding protein involved in virulence
MEMRYPAYISSLHIGNIRCFNSNNTLIFAENDDPFLWNVILGNNASGKTTLLQSISLFLEVLRNRRLDDAFEIATYVLDNARNTEVGILFHVQFCEGANSSSPSIRAEHQLNEINADIFSIRKTPLIDFLNDFISKILNGDYDCLYLVYAAYGSGRRAKRLQQSGSSDYFGHGLFSDDSPIDSAAEWLLQIDYTAAKDASGHSRAQKYKEIVEAALIDLLPDVSQIRYIAGEAPKYKSTVEFLTPDGWLTLEQLSLGYRTLTSWMVDFARRLFEHYPDSPNPLAEPAICLVDEIDLHLHPKWQRQIVGHLRSKFPRTQFIVTAHSPLVVQASASAGGNIAVLRRTPDGVVIDQSSRAVRGWRIDQLLTSDLFELETARPPEFDALMRRRRELLTKPTLTEAEQREVEELNARMESLPGGETPEEMEAMELIMRAANRLRSEQPGE